MKRYFLPAELCQPFLNGRTGEKPGSERLGFEDAPGRPKTKTTVEVPTDTLASDIVTHLPDTVRNIGRELCGLSGCVIQTGLETDGSMTELFASCTGPCLEEERNIPEQAILAVAKDLACT